MSDNKSPPQQPSRPSRDDLAKDTGRSIQDQGRKSDNTVSYDRPAPTGPKK